MTVQRMLNAALLFVSGVLAANGVGGIKNGLTRTPQMGWRMVDVGLRDAGHHYVVLDDCWSQGRSENGRLVANSTRFPKRMRHVTDRIHELGMGFGMYSSAGSLTCARYEASLGYEDIDAQTLADWGVDYLKYGNCFNEGKRARR
ncbi:hypothetical protein H2201_005917 [Coniosporium apollinis]|uniref:Alpha-galactosidase n=2 Tax=Coniosporium TaxID=2810619 RepID=A0ABQ9NNI6_9PEZI|nr:hypothetical protein H2199_006867 [Cladosporium sp. JES 115]KAJ9662836.1 hypothetical protein H2201_005917 [Coniosporium apollinis]